VNVPDTSELDDELEKSVMGMLVQNKAIFKGVDL
jgi:hypothetical protein